MYTNFEKEKLGKTFQYYRKIKNIKWKTIISESYISKNTYSKMANGHTFTSDDYYDEFIRFFNLNYVQNIELLNWKDNFIERLNDALEIYQNEEINKLYLEFHAKLDSLKFNPIFEQYYICFDYIFRYYYENKYLDEKEIEIGFQLIKCDYFEEMLAIYLLEVMYYSNNNSIGKETIRKQISNLLIKYNHPIISYLNALNDKIERKLEKALDIFIELKKYWENKNNQYRIIKALNGMFMIYKNIDSVKALKTINEFEDIKKRYELPKSLIKAINYNIGIYCYINNYFEEAYPIFLENVKKYDGIQELIFLGYICSQLNKELPDCFNNVDYRKSNYKEYIDFYVMKKKNKDPKDLVNYIMNVLLENKLKIEEDFEPLWKIFEYEMFLLLEKSKKNYNSYVKFKNIEEKSVKNY